MRVFKDIMNTQNNCRGFTLIDILITMSIVAIVSSFAVPGMQSIVDKNRMATVSNEFVGSLQLARSEAIKRGSGRIIMRRKDNAEWESGWQVFVDFDDDAEMDNGNCIGSNDCLIQEYSGLQAGYTLRPSSQFSDWIGYRSSGQSIGNNGANGTFYICPRDGDLKQARKVFINLVGRVKTKHFETGDTCPS